MKTSDRSIIGALAAIGILAAFWMLVISPKRSEEAELSEKAAQLRDSIASLEAEASAGQAARDGFADDYRRLVVLGKAVPSGHEQADLIVGLDRIGDAAGVSFRSIELTEGPATPPAPVTSETQTDQNQAAAEQDAGGVPAAVPAAATESVASSLPLGASIGPAGLGLMAWKVQFEGDFFDINSVLAAIDRAVRFEGRSSRTQGRLVTVDGFNLTTIGDQRLPELAASISVRSYVVPENEGLMLGATPEGPALTPVTATQVSAVSNEVTP